jgi:hypothetical protein
MAATPLYLPVHIAFTLAAAGHALTTRATYTVPLGKIAEASIYLAIGEPAGGSGFITCNNIYRVNAVNLGLITSVGIQGYNYFSIPIVYLNSGDVLDMQTNNGGAVNTAYIGVAEIREYQ